jgi:TolB protein
MRLFTYLGRVINRPDNPTESAMTTQVRLVQFLVTPNSLPLSWRRFLSRTDTIIISSLHTTLIVIVALAGAARCQAQETSTPSQFYDSKIAFMSVRDENWEIYTINPDGSELTRLTDHEAKDTFPSWAPDGCSIAFVSDRDGGDQIYVMDPEGSNIQKLTDTPGEKKSFSWAPDGRAIAFLSSHDGDDQIYVVDPDGINLQKLTDGPGIRRSFSWSPDGKRLAFVMFSGKYLHIHILNRKSGKIRKLCKGDLPAWSPDGSKILLISGQLAALGVIDIDGGKVRAFIQPGSRPFGLFCTSPRWSPDGKFVAYTQLTLEKSDAPPGREMDVYIVNHDGKEPRRLTDSSGYEAPLGFSTDGKSIVIGHVVSLPANAESEKAVDLYIMNIDGSGRRKLASFEGNKWSASWSPRLSTRK